MKEFCDKEVNNELKKLYNDWGNELQQLEFYKAEYNSPEERKYSNPHYCFVPDGWCESKVRVIIYGEEGHGEPSKIYEENNKDFKIPSPSAISEIQTQLKNFVNGERPWNYKNCCTKNWDNTDVIHSSQFWRRYKQIEWLIDNTNLSLRAAIKQDAKLKIKTIWNECDKICNVKGKDAKLTAKEREQLHNIKIDGKSLLKKEIEILKPTHIIFLGWRTTAFNSIGFKIDNLENYYTYKECPMKKFNSEGINVYMLYHPQGKSNKNYSPQIEYIIEEIKKYLI